MADERNVVYDYSADTTDYVRSMESAVKVNKALDSSLEAVNAESGKFGKVMTGIVMGVGGMVGMKQGTLVAASYEKSLSNLKATTTVANKNFGELSKTVSRLSKDFPQTFGDSRQVVESLTAVTASSGKTSTQLNKMAETVTKLSGATGTWAPQMAKDFGLLSKQFGNLDPKRFEAMADSLTTVSAKMGTSAASVTSFAKMIGPLSQQAGIGQSAVQGIAAAFTSLGEEGGLAANSFNQIISMMNRSVRDGTPELQFFADMVGKTNKQFTDLFKANPAEAITQLFDVIGGGGPNASRQLEAIGLDSTRLQRQVQLLSQSGGLRQAVSTATAAYGSGSTGKGAEASFGGLSDSMMRLTETSKQLAAALGSPLLGPMSAFVSGLAEVADWFTKIAENPAVKVVTTGAGAVGGAFGAITTASLAAMAMRSQPARGVFGGFTAGMMGAGDRTDDELRRTGRGRYAAGSLDRYTAGALGPRSTAAFERTYAAGESTRAAVAGLRPAGAGVRTAWSQVGRAFAAEGIRSLYIDPLRRGRGVEAGGPPSVRTALTGSLTGARETFKGAREGGPDKAAMGMGKSLEAATKSLMAHIRAIGTDTAAVTSNSSAQAAGAKQAVGLSGAMLKLGVEMGAFTAKLAIAGAQLGKTAVTGLAGMMGGPLGVAMAGVMGGMWAWGKKKENDAKKRDEQIAQFEASADPYSVMRKYNDALGLAVPQVNALAAASGDAAASVITLADALTVGGSDVRAANAREEQLASFGEGSAEFVAQQISAAFGTALSPEQMQSVKLDLVKQFGSDFAEDVIGQFAATNAGGIQLTGGQATTDDLIKGIVEQSNKSGDWTRQGIEDSVSSLGDSLAQQHTQWEQQGGKEYADAKYDKAIEGLTQTAVTIENENDRLHTLQQLFEEGGISTENAKYAIGQIDLKGSVKEQKEATAAWLNAARIATDSQKDIQQLAFDYYGSTNTAAMKKDEFEAKYGAGTYDQMTQAGTEAVVKGISEILKGIRTTTGAGTKPEGAETIGNLIWGSAQSKAARTATQELAEQPGSRVKAWKAGTVLLGEAQAQGYTTTQTSAKAALAAAGTAPGAGQEQAIALATAADRKRAQELRGMSSGEQYAEQTSRNTEIVAGLQAKIEKGEELREGEQELYETTIANQDSLDAERQEYLKGIVKMYREYYVQRDRMEQDFGKQQARAQEDYGKQRARAQEDYNTQMARSAEDYAKTRYRATRDFNIQINQAVADYNKQRMRAQRDFDKQMARQAQDAAKAFYSPYQQIQVQNVWDTQNLLVNMAEQNDALRKQKEGIEKLKQMGLSQEAIDLLGLSESQNAQQLQQILADAQNDPQLLEQLKASAAERVDASAALLTESPGYLRAREDFDLSMADMETDFNEQLRRQREAFDRQMTDMAEDYAKQMQRAAEDFAKAMSRMAADFASAMARMNADYKQALARAKEDVDRAAEEITGSLEELANQTMKAQQGMVDDLGTTVVNSMDQTIDAIKKKSPDMMEALAEAGLGGWTYDAEHGYFTPGGPGGGEAGKPRADGRFVQGSGSFTPPTQMAWPAPIMNAQGDSANTKAAMEFAKEAFRSLGIRDVGGYGKREIGNKSDHQRGKALDIMVPNYQSAAGQHTGQMIANWYTQNANQFGTKMVIWRDMANQGQRGWQQYTHPSQRTDDSRAHRDHVHVSLLQRGGIATSPTLGIHGEAGPETIIPLDRRGAAFFTDVLRRYVAPEDVRRVLTAPYDSPSTVNNAYAYDQRTMFTGEVKVQSNDPNDMARKLEAKARQKRTVQHRVRIGV